MGIKNFEEEIELSSVNCKSSCSTMDDKNNIAKVFKMASLFLFFYIVWVFVVAPIIYWAVNTFVGDGILCYEWHICFIILTSLIDISVCTVFLVLAVCFAIKNKTLKVLSLIIMGLYLIIKSSIYIYSISTLDL